MITRQNEMILGHMLEGKSITTLDALNNYGCFRLSARIYDLKKEGYPIKSKYVEIGNDKKHVKVYWMDVD